MPCYQCSRAALYVVQLGDNEVPLCLDCYFKFSQIQQQQLENNERLINYFSDQMDMTVGFGIGGPRFPTRPQPVYMQGVKLNNINVNNSVVGTINTGSINSIDQSITALQNIGNPDIAQAVKELSEAIIGSGDLTPNQKNTLVESLSTISREAASPPEARQNTVANALLEKAMQITSTANDITDVCQKWWPVLLVAFQNMGS